MADVAKLSPAADAPGIVMIAGRVEDYRAHEGAIFTVVAIPAPDAFSMPGVVEIRSADPLGAVGQMVDVRCKVSGYPGKPFTVVDEKTGRNRSVRRVNVTLEVVR